MTDKQTEIFFSIWRNVYLNVEIFKHVSLFKENKSKSFNNRNSLIQYKYSEYVDRCYYFGEEMLKVGDLTNYGYLKTIIFCDQNLVSIKSDVFKYSTTIEEIIYPISLKSDNTTQSITSLPHSVKTIRNIVIGNNTTATTLTNEQQYSNTITSTIENIYLLPMYNFKLDNYPFNGIVRIKVLEFGYNWCNNDFKLEIGQLPNTIETLNLGKYRKSLEIGTIPNSVTNLTIGFNEGTLINLNTLPVNLKILSIISKERNITITNESIPNSLTNLKLNAPSMKIDKDSFENLNNLTGLYLDEMYDLPLLSNSILLPISFKKLTIGNGLYKDDGFYIDSLPNGITNFNYIDESYRSYQLLESNLKIGFFPQSLTDLKLLSNFNCIIGENVLPKSLLKLEFGDEFNQSLNCNVLPVSLTSLKLGWKFNKQLNIGTLPQSLLKLTIRGEYEFQLTSGIIPSNVIKLHLKHIKCSKPLELGSISNNIQELILNSSNFICKELMVSEPINPILPKSLKILVIHDSKYINPSPLIVPQYFKKNLYNVIVKRI